MARPRIGARGSAIDRLASSNAAMSVLVVLLGFLVGTVLVLAVGRDPANMYKAIAQVVSGWDLARGTWNARYIGEWLVASVPLILCGLSMAFAARAGLFNIGAEGQYIVGLTVAQFAAFLFPPVPVLHWIVAVALGALAAAGWGGIVGFLKAKYAVSEVVATIMMNYIALYASRYATQFIPGTNTYKTPSYPATARLTDAWLEGITNGSRLNTGLFVMLAAVLLFWYIMERTRTGFALRATGFNKDAARASGINVKGSLALSMAISGAFAGLAGCIVALGSFGYGRVLAGFDNYGFNGIAVALVGNSSAIGTFLAGLLFGMLQSAQPLMQSRQIPKEVTYIISGLVVVFISLRAGMGLVLEARAKAQAKALARKEGGRDE
jgi:general nucleoside transport system permease protein